MDNTSPLARPGDTNWFTAGMAGPVMNERGQVLFDGGKAWTTTPPDDQGFYWVRRIDGKPYAVLPDGSWFREFIVCVIWNGGEHGRFYILDKSSLAPLPDNCEWLGPLPVPEPPK